MKAGRLIEALKQVSPDTEVMCGVTIEDTRIISEMKVIELQNRRN